MQFGVGWWLCEYAKNHPIVPNQRVQWGWFQLAGANVCNSWTFRELSWSLSASVCRVIPSGELDELLKESVFEHFAVVRNSSFNKTYTIRSFHTGANWSTSSFGRSACGFFRFLLTEMMGRLRWKSLSGLAGEATSNTTVYNGFSSVKRNGWGLIPLIVTVLEKQLVDWYMEII